MATNRFELLPTFVATIAAGAGGLATLLWACHDERDLTVRLDPPRRGTAAIRWPVDASNTDASDAIALLSNDEYEAGRYPVRLSAPRVDDWDDPMATRSWLLTPKSITPKRITLGQSTAASKPVDPTPVEAFADADAIADVRILLPRSLRCQGGASAPIVLTNRQRQAWSVAGIDSLALAHRLGRSLSNRSWADALTLGSARLSQFAKAPVLDRPDRQRALPRLAAPLIDQDFIAARSAKPTVSNRKPTTPVVRNVRPTLPTKIDATLAPGSIADYLAARPAQGAFPIANALGEQLDRVAEEPSAAAWAWAVAYRLGTLSGAPANDSSAIHSLTALQAAIDEALADADRHANPSHAAELRRAAWAIRRRVATWRPELSRVQLALRDAAGESLRDARWAMAPGRAGMMAGLTLHDPNAPSVGSAPIGNLRIARRLEAYESNPSSPLATLLANDAIRLAQSPVTEERDLAQAIQRSYRNANLRVAIASELIDRLLPDSEPVAEPIRGRVAGTPVSGRSQTTSELSVHLTPDPQAWRIGLEATGVVDSRTRSHGGPAVMRSRGATRFVAKKLVVLTPEGVRMAPATSNAVVGQNRLLSISTNYDRLPLVSDLVRSTARREYRRLQPRAQAETRQRVERRVNQELDLRVDEALARFDRRYQEELVARLDKLNLSIEPIEMRTTEQRVIGRLRIANDGQLAAHTPRMRAPSDSLFSLQLHESTLNNVLAGLQLAGETLTPAELKERLESRLGVPPRDASPEPGVMMRFAHTDPVLVRLQDGKVQLTFAVDAISIRGRRHRDFKVHAFFRPSVNGLTAELVQDGTPSIEGQLRSASRLHLHGVFGKVLGEGRRVPLLRVTDETPEALAAALVGMATNQLVIEDGWLGLAIGPQRDARRVALQIGTYVR